MHKILLRSVASFVCVKEIEIHIFTTSFNDWSGQGLSYDSTKCRSMNARNQPHYDVKTRMMVATFRMDGPLSSREFIDGIETRVRVRKHQ